MALDRAARQLRNLSNPTVNVITTIDRAQPHDLIFQTSDPAKTWVRYCLQPGGGGAGNDATLWETEDASALIEQRCAARVQARAGTGSVALVQHVTNLAGGANREVFTYECTLTAPAGCPSSVRRIPEDHERRRRPLGRRRPAATSSASSTSRRASSCATRTRPRPPRSACRSGSRRSVSCSTDRAPRDPEGRTLEYFWFEGLATEPVDPDLHSVHRSRIPGRRGRASRSTRSSKPTTAGQKRTFYLLVRDPGCLTNMTSVEVTVPS